MKNCRVVAMAVVLLMTVALSGCIGPDGSIITMPPSFLMPPGSKPDKMTIDIYWDATVSMNGFTKLAAGNTYRKLPDLLGELGGSLGEVHFFRFGEEVVPIEGRDYRRFRDPDFCYTEKITSFANVVDKADPNHLSVVITDLFESDADWSNITQKLREKYFSKHLSVAIIGIKNSFYGEIFDVGFNAAKFSYNSGDVPARFRPFYLFLMGSEPQVRTFLENWKAKISSSEEIKSEEIKSEGIEYVVFSEYLATYIADTKNTLMSNMIGDSELRKADSRLQEVRILDSKKKAEFIIHGKLKKNDDHCCLVNKDLKYTVKFFEWVDTAVKGESIENDKAVEEDKTDNEIGLLDKISAWFDKDDTGEESNKYEWQEYESNVIRISVHKRLSKV